MKVNTIKTYKYKFIQFYLIYTLSIKSEQVCLTMSLNTYLMTLWILEMALYLAFLNYVFLRHFTKNGN